jgi:uncharacterized protein (TIGR02246 family)
MRLFLISVRLILLAVVFFMTADNGASSGSAAKAAPPSLAETDPGESSNEPQVPDVKPSQKDQQTPAADTNTTAADASTRSASGEPTDTLPPREQQSEDIRAIRATGAAFTKAYEAGDAKAAAVLFTSEAEFVDESGNVIQGRDAIEQSLTEFFAQHPECRLQTQIDSIRLISPGVAVEDGSSLMMCAERPSPLECRYTTVYVKNDGKWLTASIRDRTPAVVREHREQLQQLHWLLGDWIDEGEDALVNFSCRSTDNGNFLIRTFNILIAGREAMSGTQRIGWDPLSGKLRTWIFDSEGAWGEGFWYHNDNTWMLKCTGVNADGEPASSTSIYTFINDHTMTWQSVDNEIGGVLQPDSDVYTIVLQAPGPEPAVAGSDASGN